MFPMELPTSIPHFDIIIAIMIIGFIISIPMVFEGGVAGVFPLMLATSISLSIMCVDIDNNQQ